ncbi:uncharacterized protein BP5553_06495 [Venustampulla echinocandica]|uniref:Vacuolar calcium ion transporter n=1 Tax=Venustampulla echinocandica TaxID=2656787 RepID=A0A370TK34_9HELO|nr:uncharacterized protein BP5553_06495 [Venustampulla echinocandica]RDL35883.1 hypothetical protein BP5553_06495 [Venustampulla echinocandica]
MTDANGPHVDETQALLEDHVDGDIDSGHPHDSTESGPWHQRSFSFQNAAKVAVLQLFGIYVLLVFVPLGLVAGPCKWNSILVSIFNFLAIIPLSAVVSDSSDKLADEFGDLFGALINATLGNAAELIVGVLAVIHNDPKFAQSMMLGSILSDILFVLGCCFFSAAWRRPILKLNTAVTDTLSSLMLITAVALILPTALYSTFESAKPAGLDDQILAFSRGTAMVLLVLYFAYLYFELVSHKHLFDPQQPNGRASADYTNIIGVPTEPEIRRLMRQDTERDMEHEIELSDQVHEEPISASTPGSVFTAAATLVCSGGAIMACAHLLLDSVNDTSKATGISRTFIATILLPIASNAPECATVVTTSSSGRIDFAVGVIVGSILQIALFVTPILVALGWVIHQDMNLYFETFQTVTLFFSVLLVNHLLQDKKYTYMHGAVLVGLYAAIALSFFLRDDI